MQMYREEAHDWERTAPWIKRVGIDPARDRLADPARRRPLHARLLESRRDSHDDPWRDRAAGADVHEFQPLARMERRRWTSCCTRTRGMSA
jgi:nitrite reductase (NADH) large subunit